jgi:predicted Fe-Mo cluster-binding NifX family protein
MKIAFPSPDKTIEAEISPRFGRCRFFVIVDIDTMESYTVPNAGGKAGTGAGVQASQILSNEDVEAVIGANFGPNAFTTLNYAGIKVYRGTGVIKEVIEQFKNDNIPEITESNVPKGAGQFRR